MKKYLAAVLLFVSQVVSAQVPVTITSDIPGTLQHIETLAQMAQQLVQLKSQLDQAKQMYNDLNGLRDINQLMNNRLLSQYIPQDVNQAYQAYRRGQSGSLDGISGSLNDIARYYRARDCNQSYSTTADQTACNNKWKDNSMNQYVGEKGYQQASDNIDQLQQFVNKLGQSADAKSVADLQARIQIEQTKMQNEQMKLQTYAMMQKAQEDMKKQNAQDNTQKMLRTGGQIRF